MVAIGQRVRGIRAMWQPGGGKTGIGWLTAPSDGSWAAVEATATGAPYEVEQAGPRNLYHEVRTAYRWWRDTGKPAQTDWRVTVTPAGQDITLAHGRQLIAS
jgi:hypothetical protein